MTRVDRARWADVERAYQDAMDLPPGERSAYLETADLEPEVRQEVESLLRYDAGAGEFLEQSALDESAKSLVAERGPLPPGCRIGGYEILEWLDAGGMGDVYRARDLRLQRDVALKVIRPIRALDRAAVARFEDEARAASTLSHPNIVTIYAVGEDEGQDVAFIAMELVVGRTLREVLAGERLGVLAALDLAVQLADGLVAAHAAGIVHRDLKPENVMLTPSGLIKVLDFGIAKRGLSLEPGRGPALGTAGYMSPEQAARQDTTPASDQFSFGAMLYEMLSGARAFEHSVPRPPLRPLQQVNPDVPVAVATIVERCLAPSPEQRYRDTQQLALELRTVRDALGRNAVVRLTRRRALLLAGAAVITTAAGATAWSIWRSPRARSLAVLPFLNVDRDPAVEYLCDGLAEHLIRRISTVSALQVRARSASFNFRDGSVTPGEAGRRLQVDAVLTGSLRVSEQTLTVDARLVDVASGTTLWEETYERRAADLVAMQDELARAIVVEGVRQPMDAAQQRAFDRPATEDPEANDLYLRGVYLHRQSTEEDYQDARMLLQQAVARDPAFSLAWVSLASTYSAMAVDGFERPNDAWPASNRAVRRALELDPLLPEAHAEQASSWFFFDRDWTAAELAWKRALDSRPSPALPDLLSATALKLWALGRAEEAMTLARRARALDSVSPRFVTFEADLQLSVGQAHAAINLYSAVLAAAPDHAAAWFGLAEAYRDLGDFQKAIDARHRGHGAMGDTAPPSGPRSTSTGTPEAAYLAMERASALREIEALQARSAGGAYVSPLDVARAKARLGEADAAFLALEEAFEDRAAGLVFLKVDRAWRNLGRDARFQAAVDAVGLP